MSIHEQITALLDGELVDAGAVDELLHVLAVSPEKRELLVDQLSLKRRYSASAASVVPPASADLAIMRGLGAVDASIAATGGDGDVAPAPVPTNTTAVGRRLAAGAAAVLLMLGAYGAGYWTRGDANGANVATSVDTRVVTADGPDAATASALAGARDSIAMLADRLAAMSSSRTVGATPSVAARSATGASAPVRIVYRDAAPVTSASSTMIERSTEVTRTSAASAATATSRSVLAPLDARSASANPAALAAHTSAPSDRGTTRAIERPAYTLDATPSTPLGMQVGVRRNFRLSLPRVYGLSPAASALSDQELVFTYELGNDPDDLMSRLRAGVAAGQTQFSQVLHTNTGGASVDTVIEQSPQAYFARAFVAPDLVRFEQGSGMLEVGGGYSDIGGFGTVGLNVEYRPVEQLAVHMGVSSWLLWTSFRGAINLSTNVNAHLGIMYGF